MPADADRLRRCIFAALRDSEPDAVTEELEELSDFLADEAQDVQLVSDPLAASYRSLDQVLDHPLSGALRSHLLDYLPTCNVELLLAAILDNYDLLAEVSEESEDDDHEVGSCELCGRFGVKLTVRRLLPHQISIALTCILLVRYIIYSLRRSILY